VQVHLGKKNVVREEPKEPPSLGHRAENRGKSLSREYTKTEEGMVHTQRIPATPSLYVTRVKNKSSRPYGVANARKREAYAPSGVSKSA